MIRIIKGTFGYFDGFRVVPKTKADGPFECDRGLAERLVSEGIAEYVGEEAEPADAADEAEETGAGIDESVVEPDGDDDQDVDLSSMTKAELVEVAKGYGIATSGKTKAELIDEIEASEEPPQIGAAEVE